MEFDQHQKNWNFDRAISKVWNRVQNTIRYTTHNLVDDSIPTQTHQTMGFEGETRDDIIRVQQFGFSTNPPVGSKGITISGVAGDPGQGVVMANDDPRYRPNGKNGNELKSGETQTWMVDNPSSKDGTGGKMRLLSKGAKGWLHSLFGSTINIGTSQDTMVITIKGKDITITGGNSVTINAPHGDVKLEGISLVNHVHSGVTPGSGNTGKPVGG